MYIARIILVASAFATVAALSACTSGDEAAHDHSSHGSASSADAADDSDAAGSDEHAGHDHGAHSAAAGADVKTIAPSSDYPLGTCVVSGEELGDMGDRIAFEYEGEEVQLCCEGCVDDFKESPADFVAKVKEARGR